ncbi:Sortase family protein [compost metagenome]
MFESRYSGFLTALLIIVIVAIVGLLGYLGFDYYQKFYLSRKSGDYVDAFLEDTQKNVNTNTNTTNEVDLTDVDYNEVFNSLESGNANSTSNSGSSSSKVQKYQGFNVLGTIEIPVTKLKYPVLENSSKKAIEIAVGYLYGPGLNKQGNTTIVGHNYRNGLFFSNNKNISIGDKIYITDLEGKKVEYTVYNKYETTPEDSDYITRDTKGAREISLSTCTDDSKARLIIWAKAD